MAAVSVGLGVMVMVGGGGVGEAAAAVAAAETAVWVSMVKATWATAVAIVSTVGVAACA